VVGRAIAVARPGGFPPGVKRGFAPFEIPRHDGLTALEIPRGYGLAAAAIPHDHGVTALATVSSYGG
jgi:hypothetical protein